MDDPNLRTEFHRAIDAVAPAKPWLGTAIREDLRRRRQEGWGTRARPRPTQTRFAIAGLTMVVLAVLVGTALLVAQLYASTQAPIPGGHPSPSPSPRATPTVPTPTLTVAEQTQLKQLALRPLRLPAMPTNGQCPDGPHSDITPYAGSSLSTNVWGLGPVYLSGGNPTVTPKNAYFDITLYTDPTVTGVVLIRGQQLGGKLNVVYVGSYAAGRVVGTDTISGKLMTQYAEAALPGGRPPTTDNPAQGWAIWHLRQGIGRTYIGCTGFQLDTAAGSEVVVAYDSGAASLRTTP